MSIYAVNGKEPIAAWIESLDPEAVTSSKATDLVGTNHGTLTNMDLTADPDTSRIADTGAGGSRALIFDGSNDYVSLGTSAALSISGEMSISAWYKSSGFYTQDQVILGNCDSGGGFSNYVLSVGYSGNRVELWQNAAGPVLASSVGINDTDWHHIVSVRTGSTGAWNLKIYLDGTLVANANTTVNATAGTRPTSIGRFGTFNGYHLRGLVDDVRLFNVGLDADDVAYLRDGGNGRGIVAATGKKRPRINGSLINSGLCRSSAS